MRRRVRDHHPGRSGPDRSQAPAAGVTPVGIWLTHAHIDHVLGVPRLKTDTGPRSTCIRRTACCTTRPGAGLRFAARRAAAAPDRELAAARRCGRDSSSRPSCPGTRRGVSCSKSGRRVRGDVLFQGSIGGPTYRGDFDTLLKSIERELLTLRDSTIVYSGHGPETTVGRERRANPSSPALPPRLGRAHLPARGAEVRPKPWVQEPCRIAAHVSLGDCSTEPMNTARPRASSVDPSSRLANPARRLDAGGRLSFTDAFRLTCTAKRLSVDATVGESQRASRSRRGTLRPVTGSWRSASRRLRMARVRDRSGPLIAIRAD